MDNKISFRPASYIGVLRIHPYSGDQADDRQTKKPPFDQAACWAKMSVTMETVGLYCLIKEAMNTLRRFVGYFSFILAQLRLISHLERP